MKRISHESKDKIENLIEATIEYGVEFFWADSDIIEALVSLGVTEEDFKDCGYGDFVKNYFDDGEN